MLNIALGLELSGTSLAEAPQDMRDHLAELASVDGSGIFAAQAMLRSAGLADFGERIVLPQDHRNMSVATTDTEAPTAPSLLSAYPNPSDGKQPLYLVATKVEGMEELTIRVLDPLGREVLAPRLQGASSIVELQTKGLVSGMYVAGLFADGTQVATVKFQAVR